MLMMHNYSGLANRFGYALAYGREHAAAIEADFLKATASPYNATHRGPPSIAVKYFRPNSAGLFAVVECTVPVAGGAAVLLELIVSGKEEEKHVTMEDISGVVALA